MTNLALVLSEPIYGAHYVHSDLGLWQDVVAAYLAEKTSRRRLADAGHSFVMGELSDERAVQRVLEVALG